MENIDVPVSVSFVFDSEARSVEPRHLKWNGRIYEIEKIGLHHTFREGRILYHVFSLSTKTLFMKLCLNTETLDWRLLEISDAI